MIHLTIDLCERVFGEHLDEPVGTVMVCPLKFVLAEAAHISCNDIAVGTDHYRIRPYAYVPLGQWGKRFVREADEYVRCDAKSDGWEGITGRIALGVLEQAKGSGA